MDDQAMKDAEQFLEALFPVLDGNNRIEVRILRPGCSTSIKDTGRGPALAGRRPSNSRGAALHGRRSFLCHWSGT